MNEEYQRLVDDVLRKRYYLRDENGRLLEETPAEMFERVAVAVAEAEDSDKDAWTRRFYDLMNERLFLPNSPTLVNAGTDHGTLSACFVVPVPDSLDGIYKALTDAAKIHKAFGGTGFSFSRIRPKGDVISTTGGQAAGPVEFMKLFDASTEAVRQGGRREGANMGILEVSHPDIFEFVTCKSTEGSLRHFNISVAVTDDFMEAVLRGNTFPLINPRNGSIVRHVDAAQLFDLIAHHAWQNGEPGVWFIDRVNQTHSCPHLGRIEACNPCGEQELLPYESCNLGSINLAKHVKGDTVDWTKLKETVRIAVRFLDDVITINRYPLPEIEKATLRTRKIGLGIMGWHDMLLQLGIPYDSPEAIVLAKQVMQCILEQSVISSCNLAEERGTFPAWEGSTWYAADMPIRNATTTTIAPTGSISLIAGCSSGIEPVFQWSYIRRTEYGEYEIVHPLLTELYGDDWREVVESNPKGFKTALDIHWEWHVKMQAAFQEYVHNAVSKTINMPETASVDDVKRAILMAWQQGCKGITIYRVGSRRKEVLSIASSSERPKALTGQTIKARSGCGELYVTINELNGRPYEVFVKTEGGCEANNETIGRLISLALRNEIPAEKVIQQLRKVKCVNAMRSKHSEGRSCADIIGHLLEQIQTITTVDTTRKCPECQTPLTFGEGCNQGSCPNCGWSGCS